MPNKIDILNSGNQPLHGSPCRPRRCIRHSPAFDMLDAMPRAA